MKISVKKIINLSVLVIAIFALCLSGYFYYQVKKIKNTTDKGSQIEVKDLTDKVARLYLIPTNDDPTIATVSDPSILKDQSFFNLAEKGDKVLIFNKTGKAILYRPSIDRIIEVAPIKNSITSDIKNNINQDVSTAKEKNNTKTN